MKMKTSTALGLIKPSTSSRAKTAGQAKAKSI